MVLASEEQLKRFEKFGSTGIAFMLVMVASALTVVVAIALKWLGVIRGDTQMMTSVIATAVGAVSLLLAKSASEFTFELQPASTQQKQTQAE
jgi:ABC-type Zn2+ transport system substrate-binding protein/surface adhesin